MRVILSQKTLNERSSVNEISQQKLEELKWLTAYLGSLDQARWLLTEANFSSKPGVVMELANLKRIVSDAALCFGRLKRSVETIQIECEHELLDCVVHDPNRDGVTRQGGPALIAKVCKHCKAIIERPADSRYDICFVCWSPMEALESVFERGLNVQRYKCTNPDCDHGLKEEFI